MGAPQNKMMPTATFNILQRSAAYEGHCDVKNTGMLISWFLERNLALRGEEPGHGGGWTGMPHCPFRNNGWMHSQTRRPGLHLWKGSRALLRISLGNFLAVSADFQRAYCRGILAVYRALYLHFDRIA
jgi:hypothetical protein